MYSGGVRLHIKHHKNGVCIQVESVFLVFTHMPGESYHRRLRSLLLYLCYIIWALINSLVGWFFTTWADCECVADFCTGVPRPGDSCTHPCEVADGPAWQTHSGHRPGAQAGHCCRVSFLMRHWLIGMNGGGWGKGYILNYYWNGTLISVETKVQC